MFTKHCETSLGVRSTFPSPDHAPSSLLEELSVPSITQVISGKGERSRKRDTIKDYLKCSLFPRILCELATRLPVSTFVARPARSYADLIEAYRIVYRGYHKRGYCKAREDELFFTKHNLLPETRTFVLQRARRIAGTVSVFPDSAIGLPLESIFPEEVARLRRRGIKLAEVGSLSLDTQTFRCRGFSLTSIRKMILLSHLFRMTFGYLLARGTTHVVIAVHPKHESLYRFFAFVPIGEVRSYGSVCDNPARMMILDIPAAIRDWTEAGYNADFFISAADFYREYTSGFYWNHCDLEHFFGSFDVAQDVIETVLRAHADDSQTTAVACEPVMIERRTTAP